MYIEESININELETEKARRLELLLREPNNKARENALHRIEQQIARVNTFNKVLKLREHMNNIKDIITVVPIDVRYAIFQELTDGYCRNCACKYPRCTCGAEDFGDTLD